MNKYLARILLAIIVILITIVAPLLIGGWSALGLYWFCMGLIASIIGLIALFLWIAKKAF